MNFWEKIKIIVKSMIKNFCIYKKTQKILIDLKLKLKKYNLKIIDCIKNFLYKIQQKLKEYFKKLWNWIKNIF